MPFTTMIGPCRGAMGPGLRRGDKWGRGLGLFHKLSGQGGRLEDTLLLVKRKNAVPI